MINCYNSDHTSFLTMSCVCIQAWDILGSEPLDPIKVKPVFKTPYQRSLVHAVVGTHKKMQTQAREGNEREYITRSIEITHKRKHAC